MKPPRFELIPIRRLRRQLEDRVFAVPKVQREFVWNVTRAAALLDSIFRGMPIGSILVWETGRHNCDLLRPSLHILPPYDTQNHVIRYLIDGQQRLSVLYQAFQGECRENEGGRVIDFGRLSFRIDGDMGEEAPPWFAYRKPVEGQYVAVRDILAANWRRRLRGLTRTQLNRVDTCRGQLLNYRIPFIVLHSADIDEVRETFIRINAQGMRISAADRAFARASVVDLREMANELRTRLPDGFHNLDYAAFLLGFTFIYSEREPDVGARGLEAAVTWWERRVVHDEAARKELLARWGGYRNAFLKAFDYLRDQFAVLGASFLPSANMLATLAVFFYHHKGQPGRRERAEIRKWFWATGVGQRYSGRGYRQNILADVRFFVRLSRDERAHFRFDERADPSDVRRTEYTQPAALAKTFLCLLARRKPCYITNGEFVSQAEAVARANRGERHHVFPKGLLNNYGFRHRDYNSLCNICLVVAEENQSFGAKRPRVYLAPFRSKRFFVRAMKSHLLPYDQNCGLWHAGVASSFREFRKQRLKLICAAFEQEAGMKLFRKE